MPSSRWFAGSLRAPSRRSLITRSFLAAALAAVVLSGTTLAWTSTSAFGGHLNWDGTNTWFSTYRWHATAGTIMADIQDLPNFNGTLWLGLRNSSNQQFTNTQSWTAYGFGSGAFTLLNTSDQQIPAQYFAINGRMARCGLFCDDYFGGTLYW